jgi:hypothetical protein
VVLIIAANDVVNPAAKTNPGSPIYGMPIMNVDEPKGLLFSKEASARVFPASMMRFSMRKPFRCFWMPKSPFSS